MAYNASIQAEWDWQNAVELAEERAAAKAVEATRKEERAKAEVRERELLIQSARAFKKSGVPNSVIAESLGLPLEVVEQL